MKGNEQRRSSTNSSTRSPPSHSSLSTSSSSPSPPLSSASPPDGHTSLSLAYGGAVKDREIKPNRVVPCAQCRNIRRMCRWIEERQECTRCARLGLVCSGPQRRGKAPLSPFIEELAAATWAEEDVKSVAIGPSSSTEGWNRTHMSYALTHHLVDTCLSIWDTMSFGGMHAPEFRFRFNDERGRTSELSVNDQLLSLVYMGLGAQITEHTAILGVTHDPSSVLPVGLSRRASLLAIIDQTLERLDDDRHPELDLAASVERLGLTWMALEQLHVQEQGLVRHRLLGETIAQGIALLERAGCSEELRGEAETYLKGLAREEIRQSLECGIPSVLSPRQYHSIFGSPAEPPPLYVPDQDDISSLFLADIPSHSVCTRFIAHLNAALEETYDHLEYVLTYAPSPKLPVAVSYVWRHLEELEVYLDREFRRAYEDPRYDQLPPHRKLRRPAAYFSTLIQIELSQLLVLWRCYLVLCRAEGNAASTMRAMCSERISNELSRIAPRVALFPSIPNEQAGQYFAAVRLTLAVDLIRETFLMPWAEANPAERDLLVIGLKEASDGLPEAARLVQLLEAQKAASLLSA